jgi:hypothetical protein
MKIRVGYELIYDFPKYSNWSSLLGSVIGSLTVSLAPFFSNTSLDESVGKTELQQAVNRGASLGATCWSLGWPHCEQSYLLDLRRTANDVSSWVAIQGKSWQPRTGSPRVRGIEHPASRAKSASPDFSFSLQISARKAGRRAGREHLKNV